MSRPSTSMPTSRSPLTGSAGRTGRRPCQHRNGAGSRQEHPATVCFTASPARPPGRPRRHSFSVVRQCGMKGVTMTRTPTAENSATQFVRYAPEVDALSAHFDEDLEAVAAAVEQYVASSVAARAPDERCGSLMQRGMAANGRGRHPGRPAARICPRHLRGSRTPRCADSLLERCCTSRPGCFAFECLRAGTQDVRRSRYDPLGGRAGRQHIRLQHDQHARVLLQHRFALSLHPAVVHRCPELLCQRQGRHPSTSNGVPDRKGHAR